MRVISGKYKRMNLEGFNINGTRPTMDRVKESMFAMIQNYIAGTEVVDLFAGSGALGIEALSNGAKRCIFVDSGKDSISVVKKNLNKLNVSEEYKVLKSDFKQALSIIKGADIIFIDPPYGQNLVNESLEIIYNNKVLKKGGIIVCELENEIININNYKVLKSKKIKNKEIIVLEENN